MTVNEALYPTRPASQAIERGPIARASCWRLAIRPFRNPPLRLPNIVWTRCGRTRVVRPAPSAKTMVPRAMTIIDEAIAIPPRPAAWSARLTASNRDGEAPSRPFIRRARPGSCITPIEPPSSAAVAGDTPRSPRAGTKLAVNAALARLTRTNVVDTKRNRGSDPWSGDRGAKRSEAGVGVEAPSWRLATRLARYEQQLACGALLAVCGPRSTEHTPVSGRTSSTRRAASQSPAIAATTDRACSYPVSIRNVGARP